MRLTTGRVIASLAVLGGVGSLACGDGGMTRASMPERDGGLPVLLPPPVLRPPNLSVPGVDAGAPPDAGLTVDAGAPTLDGGTGDAGTPGLDAGTPGLDAGTPPLDAGLPRPPPPWPTAAITVYGSAQGIQELPVVAAQPDEANNLWVVTHQALYLMKPGESTFHRYTDADGLHVGLSQPPGIVAVAGGAANQAFVGYEGYIDGNIYAEPPLSDEGKFDRVDLLPDDSLAVTRFDVHDNPLGLGYWENRSVRRFLYDHWFHPGNLYVGMNHGVDRVLGDSYVDHSHVEVCYGEPMSTPGCTLAIAEWRGLAFDATGNLWMADEYTAGELAWTANLDDWIMNGSTQANPFLMAFGDPYPPFAPVFETNPPVEGSPVDIRAVAVTPDGLVWFASGPEWQDSDPQYGIASYQPSNGNFAYYDPVAMGFGTKALVDMVALPDGRLVFGTEYDGLVIWNPATLAVQGLTTANGLPGNQIGVMYLDTLNKPATLFVGTDQGLAILQP